MEYRFINGGRQYKRLLIYYYWIEKWKYSQPCKFRWFQVLGIGNTNWKILVTISVPTESNSFRSCCNSSSSSRRRVERTSGQVDEGGGGGANYSEDGSEIVRYQISTEI